jgi:calcineurin-like phosphoesterase family protein
MSKVFFTSDTHFGHGNIIKYSKRPFLGPRDKEEFEKIGAWHNGDWKGPGSSKWRMSEEAIQLMDDELLRQINAIVGENDTLYHLGDFAMPGKGDYYRKCRNYRDRITCRNIVLLWGNHDDRCIKDLFSYTYDLKMFTTPNIPVKVIMTHYAMAVWDGSHRGNIQLYGHSHSEAEPWLERTMVGRRSMDVGVDNAAKLLGAYRPFTEDEISKRLLARPGFAFDHHVGKMANTPREEELN